MRRLRTLLLPPWRRAPLRTLSSPALFASVAVTACVLVLAAASKPLFVSASASAALRQDLVRGCRYDVGLRVIRGGAVPGVPQPGLRPRQERPVDPRRASRALDRAVAPIDGVDPAVVTAHGGLLGVSASGRGGSEDATVQLIARTNAERHIDVVAETDRGDVWLPDTVANAIGVAPGERVDVRAGGAAVAGPVTVRGVFRDLADVERGPFWCSMERSFEEFQLGTPPPVALVEQASLLDVLGEARVPTLSMRWEYPPDADGWTLERATRAIAQLTTLSSSTNNDQLPLGRLLQPGPSSVDQASTVHHAQRAAAVVDASAGPVALGAAGVALLILVLAARSWLDRRRQELVVLALRGAGHVLLATKGVLEMATPVVVGGAFGAVGAAVVVEALAPSGPVERDAVRSAAMLVAVALVAALALVAVAVVAGVRRVGVEPVGAGARRSIRWEPVALALAGAAYYELRTRGSSVVRGTGVDGLVLLFPVLLLAGGAGVLARVATSRAVLRRGGTWPVAPWLAMRRLAARRAHALPVITGAAVSIGLVVFATTTSRSLEATVDAKALLGPGAEQVLMLDHAAPLPPTGRLADDATSVTRTTEDTVVVAGHPPADVLGVDPATFARAAFWDATFADHSLDALLDELDASAHGAIAVGDGLPDRFSLTLSGAEGPVRLPVRVIGRARAFPGFGYNSTRPLVVVDRELLTGNGVVNRAEVWVGSDRPSVAADAAAAGLPVNAHVMASDGTQQGNLEPQVWALEYLEVIGLAAGVVTLSGLGLYVTADAARRRASVALARRMGLRTSTGVTARAIEIVAMLGCGLVAGVALAWSAVRLVFDRLDPLPNAPPAPILRIDTAMIAASAAVVGAVAVLTAAVVEHHRRSVSITELLHDAG